MRDGLSKAATEWLARGKAKEYLFRGSVLVRAEAFADGRIHSVSQTEHDFIEASRNAQTLGRLWQVIQMVAAAIGVLSLVHAAFRDQLDVLRMLLKSLANPFR